MSLFSSVICYPNLLNFELTETNIARFMHHLADTGVTHVQINHLPDLMHPELLNQPDNVYLWFANFGPTLDMYFSSDLNRGLYPETYLDRNRQTLLRFAKIARAEGLKPVLYFSEPRFVPERFYDRHPMLRGARVDNPRISRQPLYSLCLDHEPVQQHYRQMMAKLMECIPDLSMATLFTSDSGAGFEYNPELYSGPNGARADTTISLETRVLRFINCIGEPARAVNPAFTFNLTSGFLPEDREKILNQAPDWVNGSVYGLYDWVGGLEEFWGYYQSISCSDGPIWPIEKLDRTAARDWRVQDMQKRFTVAATKGRSPIVHAQIPGHDYPRPLRYTPHPYETIRVIRTIADMGATRIAAWGVNNPPELVRCDVNREAMKCALTDQQSTPEAIVEQIASNYLNDFHSDNDGDGPARPADDKTIAALCKAWRQCNDAWETRPVWRPGGLEKKLLVCPLVPDFNRLSRDELDYYLTIALEDQMKIRGVGSHIPTESDERKRDYVINEIYDKITLPTLDDAANTLEKAIDAVSDSQHKQVLREQADHIRLAWLYQRACRNWYEAGRHLRPGDSPGQGRTMPQIIDDEIETTRQTLELISSNPDQFFRIMPWDGMTHEIGPDILNQLKARMVVMQNHRNDTSVIHVYRFRH